MGSIGARVALGGLAILTAIAVAVAGSLFFGMDRHRPFLEPEFVRDDADLLDPGQEDRLAVFHRFLLADHDIDYRVVTVKGAGDLVRFSVETFSDMNVGGKSASKRGLLLVIDPVADRVRLEVGRSLEGSFPDAFVAYVEQRQMVLFFENSRVADGILATTELIVQRVQDEKRTGGFEDHIAAEGSAGGGAGTAARIGAGDAKVPGNSQLNSRANTQSGTSRSAAGSDAVAPSSPRAAVDAYLSAMDARNADPGLPIYTQESQRMLNDWPVTPAQMDSIARAYRRCAVDRVVASGDLAVVRYRISDRACAPFFLRRRERAWRLDLTMMQTAIRFGRNNAWRLDPAADHAYAFAFKDWRFDRNGFPVRER